MARFEKNYLSIDTDISADVCRLVGAVGSVYKSNGSRVAQLVEQTLEVGKVNVSPDFQAEGRRFESVHGND